MKSQPYFQTYDARKPPRFEALSSKSEALWHALAGATIGFSIWYLHWRWTVSLNPDAMVFSCVVAVAETLFFVGTLLFFHDIWREGDTKKGPPPKSRADIGLLGTDGATTVDVFITTYDEDIEVLRPTIEAANSLVLPENMRVSVWLLDDGNRPAVSALGPQYGIGYLARKSNVGFKAGNLQNALLQTDGDLVVICDADTRIFPHFLENTTGYFRDPTVAWVQTPHWFYDIPDGEPWQAWIERHLPWLKVFSIPKVFGIFMSRVSGHDRKGVDPFMSEPALFFDVIQRRRNRNGASFCCGAGSIHRREALFEAALFNTVSQLDTARAKLGAVVPVSTSSLEPFKFHVSEDIYTSILLHSNKSKKWKSVYHPDVECRMLSPWTVDAWAMQKLKYAGGTFDIMMRGSPLIKTGMPWRTKLHYAATFWSYLSIVWLPIMLFAPALSMVTGWAPVKAYSYDFFAHIIPVLVIGELALITSCKGYNINFGRAMMVGSLPIQVRAFFQVLAAERTVFNRYKRIAPVMDY